MEKTQLAKHRADTAHLPHQPLQSGVALRWVLGQKLPRFFGQIDQDGPRLEQRQGLPPRAIGVEDGGNLVVRVQRQKTGVKLVVLGDADGVRLVGQAHFLQRNRHLDAIGRGQRIQLQPLRVLRRPCLGDRVVQDGMVHGGQTPQITQGRHAYAAGCR